MQNNFKFAENKNIPANCETEHGPIFNNSVFQEVVPYSFISFDLSPKKKLSEIKVQVSLDHTLKT